MAGARFGRNFPLDRVHPDVDNLMVPNPREISRKLLARTEGLIREPILNVLAGAWIQFETHDWFAHANEEEKTLEIPLQEGDEWKDEVGGEMKVERTAPDATRPEGDDSGPPTYTNRVTHWWDGSQLYGSDPAKVEALRSHEDGKLIIGEDGLLPLEPERGIDIAGFNDNWWLGLSLLHTTFVKEHNFICDQLKEQHPDWDDDKLYHQARVINAALMAKIHTVEWTPAILPNKVVELGMYVNWWGLLGRRVKNFLAALPIGDDVGHIGDGTVLSGNIGAKQDHGPDNVPYSLTEEFVSVYRLHPLLPDELTFRSHEDDSPVVTKTLHEVSFKGARQSLLDAGVLNAIYTAGTETPGRIALHNYPDTLRRLTNEKGDVIDLAAIDILRDRERGVPRYNDFRELIHMGRVSSFDEITDNPTWAAELEEVYGDVDKVDLMTGLFAEKRPVDFGFAETAFRVFLLMATRRLLSDPFFTDLYNAETYTQWGLDFIEETTMIDVLKRHFPELEPHLEGRKNAFAPWNASFNRGKH
ncbi:unnamed protein product [Ostreobium quekettii]|uniref:Peroxidase n=1 Tax=Ostreobium quekettii TaxID=121088 RepID=A0A8S1JAN3_9CHLO|nr:unnamed protein product [Ostreobium quekettii]